MTADPVTDRDDAEAVPHLPPWPPLAPGEFFGHNRQNTSGTLAHIWRPAPTARLKRRWVSACGQAMQHEEPRHREPNAPGVALCHQCRKCHEVTEASVEAQAEPAAQGALDLGAPPAGATVVLMTEGEARAASDAIQRAVGNLRAKIAEFDEREGWRALGYGSFRAWALAEVDDASLRHIYRLRDAADVDRSLGVTIGHTPESHARELARVAAPERPAVLERAAQIAGDAPVQARHIAEARAPFATPPDLVARDVAIVLLPDGFYQARGSAGVMADYAGDRFAKPEHAVTAARVAVGDRTRDAVRVAIDAAQDARPGTNARAAALAAADAAILVMPAGDDRALAAARWQQLQAEHEAAIHDEVVLPVAPGEWAPPPVPGEVVHTITPGDDLDYMADDFRAAGWTLVAGTPGQLRGMTAYTVRKADGSTATFKGLYQLTAALDEAAKAARSAPAQLEGAALDAQIRTKAAALGLLVVTEGDGYKLHWPGEEDELAQFDVFAPDYALYWLEAEAPGMRPTAAQSYTPPHPLDALAARAAREASAAPALLPPPAAAPADEPPANTLAWDVIGLLGADGAPRHVAQALHAARQLVALLELEDGRAHDYRVPLVYRRVAELEAARPPLGLVALQDLDEVTGTLEELAGDLDDGAYDDLAGRLRAVRSRGKAAA